MTRDIGERRRRRSSVSRAAIGNKTGQRHLGLGQRTGLVGEGRRSQGLAAKSLRTTPLRLAIRSTPTAKITVMATGRPSGIAETADRHSRQEYVQNGISGNDADPEDEGGKAGPIRH